MGWLVAIGRLAIPGVGPFIAASRNHGRSVRSKARNAKKKEVRKAS